MSDEKTQRIRELNDQFRQQLPGPGGKLLITNGVNAEGVDFVTKALAGVMAFDDFNAANDPHGEHDFAPFEVDGQNLYFKFDYFDPSGEFASEDASDPEQTMRVLTIMLAEEY